MNDRSLFFLHADSCYLAEKRATEREAKYVFLYLFLIIIIIYYFFYFKGIVHAKKKSF